MLYIHILESNTKPEFYTCKFKDINEFSLIFEQGWVFVFKYMRFVTYNTHTCIRVKC